ncbi:MAG: hypothetical protein A2126_00415 [Candidatus Woykebacteria bacterium GWB1_45_5]|uniref:Uncharacterized protein n=2 Tax=Candidatus Woykeibacteriota TaxID=1817899 RepID=A0A1G1W3F3_9BACT|nr:MAG: hypothetical protein A2113_02830 [Candidatus Woykebacteria bacterium GWA1_44_8]OGY22634.1 MAG: hypothetical protein A2126_00415 [Candidatus Woykebacteria bacterium GWB1_45_5]
MIATTTSPIVIHRAVPFGIFLTPFIFQVVPDTKGKLFLHDSDACTTNRYYNLAVFGFAVYSDRATLFVKFYRIFN